MNIVSDLADEVFDLTEAARLLSEEQAKAKLAAKPSKPQLTNYSPSLKVLDLLNGKYKMGDGIEVIHWHASYNPDKVRERAS